MPIRLSFSILSALCLTCSLFALSKDEIAALEGHLIVGNDAGNKIQVLDRTQSTWSDDEGILWEYEVRTDKDGFSINWPDFNDVKRVLNPAGDTCLLVAGNPGGIGLFNLETEQWEFSFVLEVNGIRTSTHSAEILPDGNYAVADPTGANRGGHNLRLVHADANSPAIIQSIPFSGIHGAVWDHKRQVLWAWGGSLRKYAYTSDGANSELVEIKRYLRPSVDAPKADDWSRGGHDLCAMDDQDKLMFTCRGGIGIFDIKSEQFELRYGNDARDPDDPESFWSQNWATHKLEAEIKVMGGKGASWDPATGKIAFVKQDAETGKSSRSFKVRNPDNILPNGKMAYQAYTPATSGIWYKARWFRHSSFSYGPLAD